MRERPHLPIQEPFRGAASAERFVKLERYLGSLPFLLPVHPIEAYASAAKLCVACRKKGFTPRSLRDCLASRMAEHAVPLLHDDRDFDALGHVERALKFDPVAG
jgi:predicted nucleic acid-binding protein